MFGLNGPVRRHVRRALAGLLGAAVAAFTAGCASVQHIADPHPTVSAHVVPTRVPVSPSTSPPAPAPSPPPSPSLAHRIGDAVTVQDSSSGGSITVQASGPKVARGKLGSYGYAPERGYYVTFTVRLSNHVDGPLRLSPLDFVASVGSNRHVTVQQGAAPFSGGPRGLDPTEVEPGQQRAGTVTFDVSAPHGRLTYAPGGSTVCYWTF